jgi:TRAP transporter TAXI family solute receptor
MNASAKKRNLWKYFAGATVLAMVVFGIAGYAACIEPLNLMITAGTAGGGYYRACAAFAEFIKKDIPGSTVSVMPGGAWANLERLAAKKADIAVIENSSASLGYKGKGPSKKRYDIRMLASIRGPGLDQFVILEETGIKTFEQIKKKKYPVKVYMLERISLNTLMAEDIFKAYGFTVKDIESWGGKVVYTSFRELTRMIMDGLGDMFAGGGILYPQPKFIQIGSKKRFRLLPISKEVCQKIADKYGVTTMKLGADLYKEHNGTNEPYWSTATALCFAVRPELSDEVVYNLAKILANHKEDLWKVHPQHKFYKPEVAWKNIGAAPLHPGAERFYKSMGYMR